MGARISVQFQQEKEKSIVIFSHWGGDSFLKDTKLYVKELKKEAKRRENSFVSEPLYRFDVQTVAIDFIRHITKGKERIESDLYVGVNENDGDNSDYGHHIIKL